MARGGPWAAPQLGASFPTRTSCAHPVLAFSSSPWIPSEATQTAARARSDAEEKQLGNYIGLIEKEQARRVRVARSAGGPGLAYSRQQ